MGMLSKQLTYPGLRMRARKAEICCWFETLTQDMSHNNSRIIEATSTTQLRMNHPNEDDGDAYSDIFDSESASDSQMKIKSVVERRNGLFTCLKI
jgi:hypothetical protein